jgi:hypothetical protein
MKQVESAISSKFLPVVGVIMLIVASVAFPASGDERRSRFPDTGCLMRLFGFPGGRYDPVSAGDMQLDYEIESRVGRTEGDPSLDTAEEFITTAYFSMASLPESNRREFEAELSGSGDGALRLCSMWLFRMAEYPANATAYREVISLIRKKTAIADGAIVDHYADALAGRLDSLRIAGLDREEEERFRQLVLMYMMDPVNPPPAAELRRFIARLKAVSPAKAGRALEFLGALSPAVAARFEEKSGARRG